MGVRKAWVGAAAFVVAVTGATAVAVRDLDAPVRTSSTWRAIDLGSVNADYISIYERASTRPDAVLFVRSARNQDGEIAHTLYVGGDVWAPDWETPGAGVRKCPQPAAYYDRLAAEIARTRWPSGLRQWERRMGADDDGRCRLVVTMPPGTVAERDIRFARARWGADVWVTYEPVAQGIGVDVARYGDVLYDPNLSRAVGLDDEDPATFAYSYVDAGELVYVLTPAADGVDWNHRVRTSVGPFRWRVQRCPYTARQIASVSEGVYGKPWPSGRDDRVRARFDDRVCKVRITRERWAREDVEHLERTFGDLVVVDEGPVPELRTAGPAYG